MPIWNLYRIKLHETFKYFYYWNEDFGLGKDDDLARLICFGLFEKFKMILNLMVKEWSLLSFLLEHLLDIKDHCVFKRYWWDKSSK